MSSVQQHINYHSKTIRHVVAYSMFIRFFRMLCYTSSVCISVSRILYFTTWHVYDNGWSCEVYRAIFLRLNGTLDVRTAYNWSCVYTSFIDNTVYLTLLCSRSGKSHYQFIVVRCLITTEYVQITCIV